MADFNFKIIQVTPADKQRIGAFLHVAYYPDDPVLNAMRVDEVDPGQDEHVLGIIDDGYSYAAVDDNGMILGVLLMGEVNRDCYSNRRKEMEKCSSEYFLKLLKFYETMELGAKILEVSQYDKGIEFHIAAVLPKARRKGILRALFQHGTEVAKNSGYKLVICTCASQFTANLCQSLQWSCVYCLPYIYFEQDGERVFKNPISPHLYTRIYTRYL
ncbi:uncharacterized protein LOC135846978 [Planococcus citri]|uniref:uncharacterized protein LOC135846978 n=1 Tax=Planococcus citri TaxID=170843 RepID=UPI0031F7FA47